MMTIALRAARAGWHVIPLRPNTKVPAVKHWQDVASCNPAWIRAQWGTRPYNVGIATGPSDLLVLDLDVAGDSTPPVEWAGARHGRDVLRRLAADVGQPFPGPTYAVRTPTGGLHLYFRAPAEPRLGNSVARLGWRIDTRGEGGYVVAAGSALTAGTYRALNQTTVAPLPAWLAGALIPARSSPGGDATPMLLPGARTNAYVSAIVARETRAVAAAQVGTRHETLFRAARRLGQLVAGEEITEDHARSALRAAATAHVGRDEFTAAERDTTISDGLAFGARRPRVITHRP